MQTIASILQEKHRLSTESIGYQDPVTFGQLTEAFREFREQSVSDFMANIRANEDRLAGILKHRFKCNVTIVFSEDVWPCMRLFNQYHNNVLTKPDKREAMREISKFMDRFLDADGNAKGSVNIKTAQLSGVFSEMPFSINIGKNLIMQGGMLKQYEETPEELAATVLHEMGHFFYYCEYFARTVTTNQALADLSKRLLEAFAVDQREILIAKYRDKLKLKDLDVKGLAAQKDNKVVEVALVTEVVEQSRSELECDIYDTTSSEYLADQFAVRMGGGRHFASAMYKVEKNFGNSTVSPGWFVAGNLLALLACVDPIILFFSIKYSIGGRDAEYDDPKARLMRIRNDMVNATKDKHLTDETKKQLVEDIKEVDALIEKVYDRRFWAVALLDAIVPTYRKYRNTAQLQKQLEQLGNSSLFVRAAELSTM